MGLNRRSTAILALLLFVFAGTLAAQSRTSGSVQGAIKDATGAALPGVTVTISSTALMGGKQVTTTDSNGVYRFPSLPVGEYSLEATLEGYGSTRRPGLRVTLGQALAVDLTLKMATVNESITVTAAAPVVSVVANSVDTNFDATFLDRQPLPRNFYNIIKAAPGVNADYTSSSGSAMLAYGGTTESQNAFTLDGVNVADAAAGQHWILPSIQWMEEIQVGGLGANAEYGGYTGGVINGVTKSGGNELKGGVEYYYQPDAWTADNSDDGTQEKFKFDDLAASLGGKIIQDKLWFFISGEQQESETTPYGAPASSDRKITRGLGKLTWAQSSQNRIAFMLEHDTVKNERRGIDELTLPEATSKQDGPGTSWSLDWEGLVNSSNFFSARYTGYDGRDDYLPYNGTGLSGRIDEDSGLAWVNQDIQELNHRALSSFDASWSLYKDGLVSAADSHNFKFGALYEKAKTSDVWRRNGGFTYYDDSSQCDSFEEYQANPQCGAYYIERGYGEYDEQLKYDGLAFYAQDSMRMDRWTINAGLRYGSYNGGFQSGHGDSNVYDVSFWDPRIGAVWDVKGDARSALKAHWGRYHDKMYTYLYDREASGQAAIPDQDCYWNPDTQAYDDCDAPTAISARMGDVGHAYVDEALISFEQQFGKNMLIGFDLADRRFHNIMGMTNVNQDYELITATGNPLTGGTLPIWNLLSPNDFVLTTDNPAYRDFQSVTTRFERRYADKWSARASVVWTDLQGNVLKNNGYANELRDRNGLTNADGRMEYAYSEWEAKLSGSYDLPWNLQASVQYTYLSGWYWTPYVRVSGLDYNSSTGRDIFMVERGTEQLPDRNLVDLRFAWAPKVADTFRMTFSLEVFNALNSDTVLDVYNRWGSYSLSRGTWSKRSNFGSTYQVETPRQIRAGIRFDF